MTSTIGREWGGATSTVADTRGRALYTFADGDNVVVNVDGAGLSGRGRLGVVISRTVGGVLVAHGRHKKTYSLLRAAWSTVDDWKQWQATSGLVAGAAAAAVARSRVGSA